MKRRLSALVAALIWVSNPVPAQESDRLALTYRDMLAREMPGQDLLINCLMTYFDPLAPDQRDALADYLSGDGFDPAQAPPPGIQAIMAELPPQEAYFQACQEAIDSMGDISEFAQDQPASGSAQRWPADDVGLIAVNRQGSIEEFLMQVMAMELQAQFRTPFHVVGQGGPNNPLGIVNYLILPPDGARLGQMVPLAHFGLAEGRPFFKADDFTAIAQVAFEPTVIHVAMESPLTDIAELVSALREDPESLRISCGGPCLGGWDVPFLRMLIAEGVDASRLALVSDNSFGEGLDKLRTGEVDVYLGSIRTASVVALPNTTRAIAAMSDAPVPFAPEVETVAQGLGTTYVGGMWYGIGAGPGMDSALVSQIEAGVRAMTERESHRSQMEAIGISVQFLDHDEFTAAFRQHFADVAEVQAALGNSHAGARP